MLATNWEQYSHHKHQNHKHQNPSLMQNAYLVTRTYKVRVIKTQNNLKEHRTHEHFFTKYKHFLEAWNTLNHWRRVSWHSNQPHTMKARAWPSWVWSVQYEANPPAIRSHFDSSVSVKIGHNNGIKMGDHEGWNPEHWDYNTCKHQVSCTVNLGYNGSSEVSYKDLL